MNEDRWRPKGEGPDYQLSEALAPLAPHKSKFLVLSGLSSDPDRTKAGFHDRALASFMTGVELAKGKIQVGISVDQVAAQALGKETQFASLELATEHNGSARPACRSRARRLRCRSSPIRAGSSSGCSATAASIDPAAAAARRRRRPEQPRYGDRPHRGIEEARLGPSDRRKLDEYTCSRSATSSGGSRWPLDEKPVGSARSGPARRGFRIRGPST